MSVFTIAAINKYTVEQLDREMYQEGLSLYEKGKLIEAIQIDIDKLIEEKKSIEHLHSRKFIIQKIEKLKFRKIEIERSV